MSVKCVKWHLLEDFHSNPIFLWLGDIAVGVKFWFIQNCQFEDEGFATGAKLIITSDWADDVYHYWEDIGLTKLSRFNLSMFANVRQPEN